MTELTVFTADEKVMVEQGQDRHVFQRTDDGLEYDLDESEPEQFPDREVISAVEDETGEEVADIFPLEFTMYAHDDSNTRELLRSAGLPTEEDALTDLLYYYPGELEIHGIIDRDGTEYDFEPIAIEYEGKRFTPEE